MGRDISRKKRQPAPKPKVAVIHTPKPAPPAPATEPIVVVGSVWKADDGWWGNIGEGNGEGYLNNTQFPVKRMKDVVKWINMTCGQQGYKLKEIVKI